MTLKQFLAAPFKRCHVVDMKVRATLEKLIVGQKKWVVVHFIEARPQGRGYFSRFIKKILKLGYSVKIADIINPRLVQILRHWNFIIEKKHYPSAYSV